VRALGIVVPLLALALAAGGCGRRELSPDPIPLDRVNCARCGMVVSDAATAAEAVSSDREPRFYDDLGCLAGDSSVRAGGWKLFVHLASGDGWAEAPEAFFARPAAGTTPMGYGFRAYGSAPEALKADRESRAWRWEEVVAEADRRGGTSR
jgi:copper chaperone NosL